MDKTGIIVVSICVLLLGWWFVEQSRIARQQALYQQTKELAQAQSRLAATNPASAEAAPTPATATVTTPAVFNLNLPEQLLVVTNAAARYTFTSRGGGLKLVQLLDYPQTISARWKTKNGEQANGFASLNTGAPIPSFAVLGGDSLVGDGNFTLSRAGDGVRAEKTFASGLRLMKEFHPGSNYLVQASVRLENTSDKALVLPAQELVVGAATPMDADDNSFFSYGGAMWFDGTRVQVCNPGYFNASTTILGFIPHTPHSDYQAGAGNVVWAAVFNQFFALAVMPKQPAE